MMEDKEDCEVKLHPIHDFKLPSWWKHTKEGKEVMGLLRRAGKLAELIKYTTWPVSEGRVIEMVIQADTLLTHPEVVKVMDEEGIGLKTGFCHFCGYCTETMPYGDLYLCEICCHTSQNDRKIRILKHLNWGLNHIKAQMEKKP